MISVVIACLNDQIELEATCRSIRDTAGNKVEIIVTDDCSNSPINIMDSSLLVRVIHNRWHCGVGPSRTIGVYHARNKYILICDSHMRFTPGWYEEAMRRIDGRPTTIHCATCLGLEEGRMDVNHPVGTYRGATMNVCGPDRQAAGRYQVFEGVWLPGDTADDAEIPCVMGANYFMPRDWFLKLNPLQHLRSWGGDEVMLAVKSWLAGGDCRYMKNVRIGHKFWTKTNKLPYRIPIVDLIWNQLFAIHTLTDPRLATALIDRLVKTQLPNDWGLALRALRENWREVAQEQAANAALFKHDFRWYAAKFGLAMPAG